MYYLRNQDFHDILDIIHLSNSYLEITETWQDVLPAMVKLFRAQSANFCPSSSFSKRTGFINTVSIGIDKSCMGQYSQYYYRHDPFRVERHSRKIVDKSDDLLPQSVWAKLEFYNDFLKPHNIYNILVIYLRSRGRLLATVSLYRPRGLPSFSGREVAMADILAPHLSTTLETASMLTTVEKENSLFQKTENPALPGLIVVDFNLQPVYWNSKAKEICFFLSQNRPDEDNLENGKDIPIPSEILQDCLAFKELYPMSNQTSSLYRQRILHAGQSKSFNVISRLTLQPFQKTSIPYFLLSLEDSSRISAVVKGDVRKEYCLTRREAELVQCVSEGLTNDEIAEKLFISRFTVAKHLQNIFEKTGVKNRTELATLPIRTKVLPKPTVSEYRW